MPTQLLSEKYRDQLDRVLSCYDRLIFSGNLQPLCYAKGMTHYLYEPISAYRGVRKANVRFDVLTVEIARDGISVRVGLPCVSVTTVLPVIAIFQSERSRLVLALNSIGSSCVLFGEVRTGSKLLTAIIGYLQWLQKNSIAPISN